MRAIIFDIDGTLSNCSHRLHFVKNGKRDWDSFFAAMDKDTINEPIVALSDIVNKAEDITVLLCSGRSEKYREVTKNWLASEGIQYFRLYMRPDDDFRADPIIKKELLDKIISDGFDPFLVIDDRQSVVDMWRENGITCLQCAPEVVEYPSTAILTLMIGPSGGGKSTWLQSQESAESFNIHNDHVIASDIIRRDICRDFKDQSKNELVFEALHALVKTRLRHGLPTVVDATNLHRKDRLSIVNLVSSSVPVRYIVINRTVEEKRKTGGWRNELYFDLIAKHEQTFQSQLDNILDGDDLPNVIVIDKRQF